MAILVALSFIVWPLVYTVFFGELGSLTTWLWMLPGVAIYCAFGPTEAVVTAKRKSSAQVLESASFEQFLIEG